MNYQNFNVPSTPINYTSMSWSYDYYDDGRLHHAYDSTNNWFDRSYAYDHVGRLTEATTYRRAEGLSPSTSYPAPYQQTTSYDVWNHSSRTGYLYGGGPFADNGGYTNNRHQDFGYDADGNVTNSLTYHNTIDAAGKQAQVVSGIQTVGNGTTQFPTQPAIDITQGYDGDGQPRQRTQIMRQNIYDDTNQNHPLIQVLEDVQASYYLTSSVLGGAQVMELNPNGQKKSICVYAGGQRIAKEEGGSVTFEHHNPATGSWVTTLGHSSYRTATREDVTGDQVEEAIVVLSIVTGGSALPNIVYIYTLRDGTPKLLWAFDTGNRADGGLRKIYTEQSKLVIERYSPKGKKGDCCPTVFKRSYYRWEADRFERLTEETLNNSEGHGSPIMTPYRQAK